MEKMTTNTTWGKMTTMTTQKNSTSTRSAKTEAEVSLDFVLLTIYFDTVSDSIDPLLLSLSNSVSPCLHFLFLHQEVKVAAGEGGVKVGVV